MKRLVKLVGSRERGSRLAHMLLSKGGTRYKNCTRSTWMREKAKKGKTGVPKVTQAEETHTPANAKGGTCKKRISGGPVRRGRTKIDGEAPRDKTVDKRVKTLAVRIGHRPRREELGKPISQGD